MMSAQQTVITKCIELAADFATKTLFNFTPCNSDSSEDEENYIPPLKKIRGPREKPIRTKAFLDEIVPHFTSRQFREHWRMSPEAFEASLSKLALLLIKNTTTGRLVIKPEKQLLSVIWLLATPDFYRSVADRFDMGKSSLHDSFKNVIKALGAIASLAIRWPTVEQMAVIEKKMCKMSKVGLRHVIGAVDGCHIQIKAPVDHPEVCITRKCNHAITLQGICDNSLKLLDVFVGYPGSVGDRRIFENSDIYKLIKYNRNKYVPDPYFIVGDKAYPILEWCIPPFIDKGNLTDCEKRFNTILSRVRQVIERCFALLKGRFRRLKYLDMIRTDIVPATILAACVLHNICLDYDDSLYVEDLIHDGENEEQADDNVYDFDNNDEVKPIVLASRMVRDAKTIGLTIITTDTFYNQ